MTNIGPARMDLYSCISGVKAALDLAQWWEVRSKGEERQGEVGGGKEGELHTVKCCEAWGLHELTPPHTHPLWTLQRAPCKSGPNLGGPGDKSGTSILWPEYTCWGAGHGPATLLVQPPCVSGGRECLGSWDWGCLYFGFSASLSLLPLPKVDLWVPGLMFSSLSFSVLPFLFLSLHRALSFPILYFPTSSTEFLAFAITLWPVGPDHPMTCWSRLPESLMWMTQLPHWSPCFCPWSHQSILQMKPEWSLDDKPDHLSPGSNPSHVSHRTQSKDKAFTTSPPPAPGSALEAPMLAAEDP